MTLIFFSKKTDCADFESDGTLTEQYIQSQDHHYCEERVRHFKFEESRKQHMGDKHWYCRQHDQVSVPPIITTGIYLAETYLAIS